MLLEALADPSSLPLLAPRYEAGAAREAARAQAAAAEAARPAEAARAATRRPAVQASPRSAPAARKLTFTEQHELERLPDRIEALETEQAALHEAMAQPGYFERPQADQAADRDRLAILDAELLEVMARWEELESRA